MNLKNCVILLNYSFAAFKFCSNDLSYDTVFYLELEFSNLVVACRSCILGKSICTVLQTSNFKITFVGIGCSLDLNAAYCCACKVFTAECELCLQFVAISVLDNFAAHVGLVDRDIGLLILYSDLVSILFNKCSFAVSFNIFQCNLTVVDCKCELRYYCVTVRSNCFFQSILGFFLQTNDFCFIALKGNCVSCCFNYFCILDFNIRYIALQYKCCIINQFFTAESYLVNNNLCLILNDDLYTIFACYVACNLSVACCNKLNAVINNNTVCNFECELGYNLIAIRSNCLFKSICAVLYACDCYVVACEFDTCIACCTCLITDLYTFQSYALCHCAQYECCRIFRIDFSTAHISLIDIDLGNFCVAYCNSCRLGFIFISCSIIFCCVCI